MGLKSMHIGKSIYKKISHKEIKEIKEFLKENPFSFARVFSFPDAYKHQEKLPKQK